MSRPVEDLLAEEILTFTPRSGTFDVEAVADAIAGIGFAYRDELEPSAFAIFSRADAREACKARRLADPSSTFPYVLLVMVRPDEMVVYPVEDQADLRALSEQFLQWLLSTYDCRIENDFGTDITEPPPPAKEIPTDSQPAA